jgi:hypothetical protein
MRGHGRGIERRTGVIIRVGEWNSANGQLGEPKYPGNPMVLHTPFAKSGRPRPETVGIEVNLTVQPNSRAVSIPFFRHRVCRNPCTGPERSTNIPRSEVMDSKADTRVSTWPVAALAIRSFLFPQEASPERMALNTGGGQERRRGLLVNTARAGGATAMLAEVPSVPRRIPITTWTSERDVNLLSLERVRFESLPLIDGRDGTRRRAMSPQLAWEARRKHAPCTIPISPSWRMNCRYVRIESEEEYVRRLWELTTSNQRAPLGDVSATVVCQDRPLLPLRWPQSGRKTENPKLEFSQRGCYNLPGERYARESKYALYMSSLLAGQGDPGRFFEEIRKEQANRRHGLLISWLHVEYYRVPPGMRSSLYPRVPQNWDEWEALRGMNVSGRPCEGLMSHCRRCWYTVEVLCCKETP